MVHTTAERRWSRPAVPVVIGLSLLLSVPLFSTASAMPARPSSPSTSAEWAYGGNHSFSASGIARNGTYTLTSRVGFQVLLNVTSPSNGSLLVRLERTMGAVVTVTYCIPQCSRPSVEAVTTFHAVEIVRGTTDLTTGGSVVVNGSSVPALAIVDSTTSLSDSTYENDTVTYYGPLHTHVGSASFQLQIVGQINETFAPALGLVPRSVTPGMTWTSQASFSGAGAWNSTSAFHRTTLLGVTTEGGNSLPFSTNRSGDVTVVGEDLGPITLRNGMTPQVIQLLTSGPLGLREGFFPLPVSADLFAGASVPNAPGGNATLGQSASHIDYSPSASSPLGLLGLRASSATYTTNSNNPEDPSSGGLAPAGALETSGPQAIQAQPETPTAYVSNAQCLTSQSCGAGSSVGSGLVPAALRPLVGWTIVGAAVVAVIGSAVLVTRRPRAPPRTNAALYPPVPPETPVRPVTTRPPSATARTPEPDPLGHLW